MTATQGTVRSTFKHAAVYSAATMLGRMIGFIMLPFYAHILRDIGYGVIGMIDAGLMFLGSLLTYNFHNAVLRIYHEEPDAARKPLVASTGTIMVAGFCIPIAGLGMLFSQPIAAGILNGAENWIYIVIALGTFYLDMVGRTAGAILVIQRKSATYSAISLMRLVLGLSLNILLIVVLKWGLLGYFLSALITAAISEAVAVIVMIRICGLHWDRDHARSLLSYQLPLIPGAISRFFAAQVERVVVRYQIDIGAVGVLEMAYKFPALIGMLLIEPFLKSWGTNATEIADEDDGPRRIADLFSYFLYLGMIGFVLLSVNIASILKLLTPPEFWAAARVAIVDSAQVVLMGVANYAGFGLFYAKRTDLMARVVIVTSFVKVAISYAMIAVWGLYGAAWSGLIIAGVILVWRWRLSQRFYRMELDWPRIAMIVGVGGGLVYAISLVSTDAIAVWGAPALDLFVRAANGLQGTALGDWKDGKVIVMLVDRGPLVLDLIVRTLLASTYLLLMPLVHIETARKLVARANLLRSMPGWRQR